jgi:hypothetical protein
LSKPPKAAAELLDTSLEVHDRKQFELKLDYQPTGTDPTAQYLVEAWFFLPRSLNVNADTWPRDDFYADLHNYVRLKTPALSFEEIRTGGHSPLVALEERLQLGLNGTETELVHDAKMLACVLRGALRRFGRGVKRRCSRSLQGLDPHVAASSTMEELEPLAKQGIADTRDVLRRFREAVVSLGAKYTLTDRTRLSLKLIDEYVSLLVEHYLRRAVVEMDDVPHTAETDALRKSLMDVVLADETYRRQNGLRSVIARGSDNEEYAHRIGFLKKFCMNILFLTVVRSSPRKAWEEVLFAIAAGGAMAFALGVGFFAQTRYPQASFNFFIMAVIGYMLKDRVKEGLRRIFSQLAGRYLYERTTHLTAQQADDEVGVCKEKVDFGGVELVPAEVAALRSKDELTTIAQGELVETVIRYRKVISLDSQVLPKLADGIVSGLTDIIRLNVERLLRDMDDPEFSIEYVDLQDYSIEEVKASKAYFVDLAFRFTVDDGDERFSQLKLARLVLDKNGIKRMVELA